MTIRRLTAREQDALERPHGCAEIQVIRNDGCLMRWRGEDADRVWGAMLTSNADLPPPHDHLAIPIEETLRQLVVLRTESEVRGHVLLGGTAETASRTQDKRGEYAREEYASALNAAAKRAKRGKR